MRMLRHMPVIAGFTLLAACGSSTDITVENLEGVWDATVYVFTNQANTSETVDIVAVDQASMVLTVQANGTTSSVFDDGQGGTSSDSGTFTAEGDMLTLGGITFQASLSGDRLTLTNDDAQFDFDDNGSDEPATARITLQRR